MSKRIAVLGSTGSIGTQTLDVVRALPDQFTVVGLAAGRNLKLLTDQIREFNPAMVYAEHPGLHELDLGGTRIVSMEEMAGDPNVDLVMVATTGRAGLGPTLQALKMGKAVALANKEVIVMAGELVMARAHQHQAPLLPVDSEPSAVWQCLQGETQVVRRIILTASGGPFRKRPLHELAGVTPAEALAHPTWVMGHKITIDSSTLMNKGFEVIESRWLFGVAFDDIDVVVHPQSIIHSMVEFADGSVKAQMGPPDMRLPIQYALLYPNRLANRTLARYDPVHVSTLTFEPLDTERYPCFRIALDAGRRGGTFPAVLSAADDEAVKLFLDGHISFGAIAYLVEKTLEAHQPAAGSMSLEAVLEADDWARRHVTGLARA